MRPKEKLEFRELTKHHASAERTKTATELRKRRSQYHNAKAELAPYVASSENEKSAELKRLEALRAEYDALDARLSTMRQSLFNRIMKDAEIRRIEHHRQTMQETIAECEAGIAHLSRSLEKLYAAQGKQDFLKQTRATLDAFYKRQLAALPEYREKNRLELQEQARKRAENERLSSVGNVIKDYNAFFVHAIHPTFIPGTNSALATDTKWQTKLEIALSLSPTVSASTVREGDSAENFFAHFGIIIREGKILSASAHDNGTVAHGIRNRESNDLHRGDIGAQVRRAIYPQSMDGVRAYNEFVVEDPHVAALFVFPIAAQSRAPIETPPHAEVAIEAKKVGLPVFIFQDGNFLPAEYSDEKKAYLPTGFGMKPIEIFKQPDPISEEVKIILRERVFADSPFRIGRIEESASEDFSTLLSYEAGRKMFTALYMQRHKLGEQELCRFVAPGVQNRIYVDTKGVAYCERTRRGKIDAVEPLHAENYRGYLMLGYNSLSLGSGIFGIRDYSTAAERMVRKFQSELTATSHPEEQALKTRVLRRLAGHCMGFAAQAELLQDAPAAQAVYRIAELVLSKEEFGGLMARRLGPNGEMRITEADL